MARKYNIFLMQLLAFTYASFVIEAVSEESLSHPIDLSAASESFELNPIHIPQIKAKIRYGANAGSYWWGGDKKQGKGLELKHSLEIELASGIYVIRPNFSNSFNKISPNLAESEVELNDHITGINYGFKSGLLILQGVTQAASSPSIEWMIFRLTSDGKSLASSSTNIPSCMNTNIPALWRPKEVKGWNYSSGYSRYKTIGIENLDSDSRYEVKTYYLGNELSNANNFSELTEYAIEFFEVDSKGNVQVDNNPSLYMPYFQVAIKEGNTWQAFYYGVRAKILSTSDYGKYDVAKNRAEKLEKDIVRTCKSLNINLQHIESRK